MDTSPPPSPPGRAPGCLAFLGSWLGLFLIMFPFLLVANVAEGYGGLRGLVTTITTMVTQTASYQGRGSEAGFLIVAGVILALGAAAIGAFLGMLLGSLLSLLSALLESLAIILVLRALRDVLRLRGSVARDDPSYGRKWGSRGALAGLAIWTWVCILVPLLSRFGHHPAAFPTAGRAVFLLVMIVTPFVVLARLVGYLRRRAPAPRQS